MDAELTLVTGGGGFLGRYLVEQLRAEGRAVRVFSRGAYPELAASGVELVRGDLRKSRDVAAACDGVTSVFHVAAIPGIWGKWSDYYETNTLGTQNVVAAALACGIRRLVYTSSPSVVFDGRPHEMANEALPYPQKWLCHYPHSKALAEQFLLAADSPNGLRTTSLRPHLIWGPRDNHLIPRLIERARSGKLKRVGDGSNWVSMSYVENVAAAHLQAERELSATARNGGKAYFVNEAEPVNLWDWIDELLALVDLEPITSAVGERTACLAGAACEGVWKMLGKQNEPPMTRFLAKQLSQSHTYSIKAAQRDFGYAPIVAYDEAIRRLSQWLKSAPLS